MILLGDSQLKPKDPLLDAAPVLLYTVKQIREVLKDEGNWNPDRPKNLQILLEILDATIHLAEGRKKIVL